MPTTNCLHDAPSDSDCIEPVRRHWRKRNFANVLAAVDLYRQQHEGEYPHVRSKFPTTQDSWRAIDIALRRKTIARSLEWDSWLERLSEQGHRPSLARLDSTQVPVQRAHRSFANILAMVRIARIRLGGRYPRAGDLFDVPGFSDSWCAIDNALRNGSIVPCPAWSAHLATMHSLGSEPSLATLRPGFRPAKRKPRHLPLILESIARHMETTGGKMPTQRSPKLIGSKGDSWKAVDQALRRRKIADSEPWQEYCEWLSQQGSSPSLSNLSEFFKPQLIALLIANSSQQDVSAQRNIMPHELVSFSWNQAK